MYEAESGNISIAVTGDAMISRRMQPFREPDFLGLLELLRSADASVANLEFLFHNYEDSWQWEAGGTYTRSDPKNLAQLKWMGIDGVLTANNHSFDFSEGGYLRTLKHLDDIDLPHAGGGIDLDHARAPGYVDTAKGRVAIMSASSTFSAVSRAGSGRPDFPGRPGINALRHVKEHLVTQEIFDALRKAKTDLGYEAWDHARREFGILGLPKEEDPSAAFDFLENRFTRSDVTKLLTSVHREDIEGISRWIRGAQGQADWLVYGVHCHESGPEGIYHGAANTMPPDFLVEFTHHAIDEGCHMVACHGPHFMRGIEIYKGRPIFYSLGNFIFQNETVTWVPPEGYRRFSLDHTSTPGDFFEVRADYGKRGFPADPVFWESVVPICRYEGKELKEITLHPIDLGYLKPVPQRGRPMLARGEKARHIIEFLQEVSDPFGTNIAIEGDTGVIRL